MRDLWLGMAVLGAVAPGVPGQAGEATPVREPAPAFKIGFVSPYVVERQSKWAARLLLEVDMEYRKRLRALKQIDTKLAEKRKEQTLWTAGSEEYDKLKLELVKLDTELQNTGVMYRRWWERRRAEATIAIHLEIEKRAAVLARKRGYAFVLKKKSYPKKGPANLRLTAIEMNAIIYAAPAHDLTQDVIQLIDAERAKGTPAGTAADSDGKKKEATRGDKKNGPGRKPAGPSK